MNTLPLILKLIMRGADETLCLTKVPPSSRDLVLGHIWLAKLENVSAIIILLSNVESLDCGLTAWTPWGPTRNHRSRPLGQILPKSGYILCGNYAWIMRDLYHSSCAPAGGAQPPSPMPTSAPPHGAPLLCGMIKSSGS